jgi:hypothetical protein
MLLKFYVFAGYGPLLARRGVAAGKSSQSATPAGQEEAICRKPLSDRAISFGYRVARCNPLLGLFRQLL